jgi:hypothetical protein
MRSARPIAAAIAALALASCAAGDLASGPQPASTGGIANANARSTVSAAGIIGNGRIIAAVPLAMLAQATRS